MINFYSEKSILRFKNKEYRFLILEVAKFQKRKFGDLY